VGPCGRCEAAELGFRVVGGGQLPPTIEEVGRRGAFDQQWCGKETAPPRPRVAGGWGQRGQFAEAKEE
jgi:hypothetical protein